MSKPNPTEDPKKDRIAKQIQEAIEYITTEMCDGSTGGTIDVDLSSRGFGIGFYLKADYESHPDWKKLQTALRKHKAVGAWVTRKRGIFYDICIQSRYQRDRLKRINAYIRDEQRWNILARINHDFENHDKARALNEHTMLLMEHTSLRDFLESGAWRHMTQMFNTLGIKRADYTMTDEGHIAMTFISPLGHEPHGGGWINSHIEVDSHVGYLPEKEAAQERVADLLKQAGRREIVKISQRSYVRRVDPIIEVKGPPKRRRKPKTTK